MNPDTIVVDRVRTVCSAVFNSETARERPGGRHRRSAALITGKDGFVAGFGPDPAVAVAAARSCPLPATPWPLRWPATPCPLGLHPGHAVLQWAAGDPAGFARRLTRAGPPLNGLIGELIVSLDDVCISRAGCDVRYRSGSVELRLGHPRGVLPAPLARVAGSCQPLLRDRIGLAATAVVVDGNNPPGATPLLLVDEAERALLGWLAQHPDAGGSALLVDDPTAADDLRWRPCDDLGHPTQPHPIRDAVDRDGIPRVAGVTSLTDEQLTVDFRGLRLKDRSSGDVDDAMVISNIVAMTDTAADGHMAFAVADPWNYHVGSWSPVDARLALTFHVDDLVLEPRGLVGVPGLSGVVVSGANLWERDRNESNRRSGAHH